MNDKFVIINTRRLVLDEKFFLFKLSHDYLCIVFCLNGIHCGWCCWYCCFFFAIVRILKPRTPANDSIAIVIIFTYFYQHGKGNDGKFWLQAKRTLLIYFVFASFFQTNFQCKIKTRNMICAQIERIFHWNLPASANLIEYLMNELNRKNMRYK